MKAKQIIAIIILAIFIASSVGCMIYGCIKAVGVLWGLLYFVGSVILIGILIWSINTVGNILVDA